MWIFLLIAVAALAALYLGIVAERFLPWKRVDSSVIERVRDIKTGGRHMKPIDDYGYTMRIGESHNPFDQAPKTNGIILKYKLKLFRHLRLF